MQEMKIGKLVAFMMLVTVGLTGCVVNPLTGEREAGFVSQGQEISIGQEQYAPAQQMQGGSYSTDPELSNYVNGVGQKLAAVSGRELPYEFVVLNNSIPNAWALPGGKIAINRGLLVELRNEAELAAVLGHEVAHAVGRHGAKRMERGVLTQGLLIAAAIGTSGKEFAAEALGAAQLAAGFLNQKYSRDAERESDYYGMKFMVDAGYDPMGAVTLQETFVRLSGERQTNWMEGLFASHPPSTERVANNRRRAQVLREEGYTGLTLGGPEYAQALARVKKAQPAYDAYDGALASYQEKDYEAALSEVNKALNIQNKEALFHGLRGAIRAKQKRYQDAVTNLDRAVALNPDYFSYYLHRGLAYVAVNQRQQAKADLDRSVRLLPTAPAFQALGQIAEAEGDTEAAKRYYAQAGQGNGQSSTAARYSLVRLDLPSQPAKYIAARAARDERGRWVLEVKNRAGVPLKNIQIQLELATGAGVKTTRVSLPKLGAGESRLSLLQVDPQQVGNARAYAVAGEVDS